MGPGETQGATTATLVASRARVARRRRFRTSATLADLMDTYDRQTIALGALGATFRRRAGPALLFLFGLPNLAPVIPPGLSAVLGLPMILIAAQMAAGRRTPRLPSWLSERGVPASAFGAVVFGLNPILSRVERLMRPRLRFLTGRGAERAFGVFLLLLCVLLALPIPLGNWLPAAAICTIALGFLERDGLAVLFGAIVGIVAIVVIAGVLFAAVKATLFVADGIAAAT